MVFFLPQDHGILRRHFDQHEPLACTLRDDDFLAQTFLPHLDMKIVRCADEEGIVKSPTPRTAIPSKVLIQTVKSERRAIEAEYSPWRNVP